MISRDLLTFDPDDKNSFSLSGYISNDYFDYYKEWRNNLQELCFHPEVETYL